ncbi:MAG: hypothetical protein IIZ97_09550 [Prevotella sp.]|nr:hypothetical protein [Prevotella sp.]
MLQQDYILRIIREFMEALQLYVSRQKDVKKKQEKILELYDSYVGDHVFYHTATMDDVMDSFTQWPVEERLYRMEMLAELYYAETEVKTGPMRQMLLERAMQMFVFIDRNSRTFSFDRQSKISRIQEILHRETAQNGES